MRAGPSTPVPRRPQTLAVLGLGRMGLPLARRLLAVGHHVVVFDPRADRAADAFSSGAEVLSDAAAVAARADVLLTVLPGPRELREVMVGDTGVLAVLRTGSMWIDLTSGDPRVSTELAAQAVSRGLRYVEAPMSGGPLEAAAGTLGFWTAGEAGDVERAVVVLALLGSPAVRRDVGARAGEAQTAKLLANLLWFGQAVATTEALLLGRAAGLDVATLRRVLAGSPGDSAFLQRHADALLAGDYLETFGIDRCVEELTTLAELADQHGVPYEVSAQVTATYRQALQRYGPADGELLAARLLEERAGQSLGGHSWDGEHHR